MLAPALAWESVRARGRVGPPVGELILTCVKLYSVEKSCLVLLQNHSAQGKPGQPAGPSPPRAWVKVRLAKEKTSFVLIFPLHPLRGEIQF